MEQIAEHNILELVRILDEAVSAKEPDNERIIEFFRDYRRLGIEVLPVALNTSMIEVFAETDRRIRLGFSVMSEKKMLPVWEKILQERQQHGVFTSFQDFCERIDLAKFSEQALEQAIQAGVFDELEESRARLFKGYTALIKAVQQAKAEKASGQFSLFGSLPSTPSQITLGPLSEEEEWDEDEVIEHEKQAIGFSYTEALLQSENEEGSDGSDESRQIQESPADSIAEPELTETPQENPAELQEAPLDGENAVPEVSDAQASTLAHEISDKSREDVALENPAPEISEEQKEVFPEESVSEMPESQDNALLEEAFPEESVSEMSERRDNAPLEKIIPDEPQEPDVEELESSYGSFSEDEFPPPMPDDMPPFPPEEFFQEDPQPLPGVSSPLVLQIDTEKVSEDDLSELRSLITQHPGQIPVVLEFHEEGQQTIRMRTHDDFRVNGAPQLLKAIEVCLGKGTTQMR